MKNRLLIISTALALFAGTIHEAFAQGIKPKKISLEKVCQDMQLAIDQASSDLSQEGIKFKKATVALKVTSNVEGEGSLAVVAKIGGGGSYENIQTVSFELDTNTAKTKKTEGELVFLSEQDLEMKMITISNYPDKNQGDFAMLAKIDVARKKMQITKQLRNALNAVAKEVKRVRTGETVKMKVKTVTVEVEFTIGWKMEGGVEIEFFEVVGLDLSVGGGRSSTHTMTVELEIE